MEIKQVCFLGLGYIGLPTAAIVANKGLKVLGVDINSRIIDTVSEGKIHIVEPGLEELVKNAVESKKLRVSTKPEVSDVYLVVVPTPFKGNHEPDISFVEAATNSIVDLLKEGDTYIIESTSPIGTTEKMAALIFKKRPDLIDKIFIAYCPERVLPGNVLYELRMNDRIIGGLDEQSSLKAKKFYEIFVEGEIYVTNTKTAEMCKLIENSSRDVQIAFANELSIICEKAGINVWELIELANKHPRVKILQPGCGVGGHCIAVDPYFLTSDFPSESQIIGKAREINNYKSFWCAEKIKNVMLEYELKNGKKPLVAFMGLSFKPNVDDLRESPAKYIIQKVMQSEQNGFLIVEPNIQEHSVFRLTDFREAYEKADIIAFLVGHKEFYSLQYRQDKTILDFAGIFKNYKN
jgi:UDP-N-acetyl-D-mannosaminuronic acid dehydrogenase